MNVKNFNDAQRQALLDLAMLAMYADGRLTAVEDERVERLLTTMGFTTEYDRNKHYDASVSRVSRHSASAAAARQHATELAKSFSTKEQRRQVHDVLDDLMASDGGVAPEERELLAVVREALH